MALLLGVSSCWAATAATNPRPRSRRQHADAQGVPPASEAVARFLLARQGWLPGRAGLLLPSFPPRLCDVAARRRHRRRLPTTQLNLPPLHGWLAPLGDGKWPPLVHGSLFAAARWLLLACATLGAGAGSKLLLAAN